jgi:hypothetical protein
LFKAPFPFNSSNFLKYLHVVHKGVAGTGAAPALAKWWFLTWFLVLNPDPHSEWNIFAKTKNFRKLFSRKANKNFSRRYENTKFRFNPTQHWSRMTWYGSAMLTAVMLTTGTAMLTTAMLTTAILTTGMPNWSHMTCRTGASWQLEIRALEPHDRMRLRNADWCNADYRNDNYRNADNRNADHRNDYNRNADYHNAD